MMITRRSVLKGAAAMAAAAGVAGPLSANAADFPSQTIKFVVPYSAGGGQDRWARMMSTTAIDHFGQALHVQSRPGAGGAVGWRYLLDQPADGHTIMIGSLSPMIAAMTEPNAPMGVDDIRMVAVVSDFNVHLLVRPDGKFDSWDKVKAYAEANPGQLTVGGTLAQCLSAANLFSQANLEVNIIPYPGTSAAVTDLLGGHIDSAVATPATVESVGDNAVSVLNLGARPDSETFVKNVGYTVPWLGDLGFKGISQPRWIGVHPDTPDDVVARLEAGFKSILEDKSTAQLISKVGEEIIFSGTAEAQATYSDLVGVIESNGDLLK